MLKSKSWGLSTVNNSSDSTYKVSDMTIYLYTTFRTSPSQYFYFPNSFGRPSHGTGRHYCPVDRGVRWTSDVDTLVGGPNTPGSKFRREYPQIMCEVNQKRKVSIDVVTLLLYSLSL